MAQNVGLAEATQKYMFVMQLNKKGITANDSTITLPQDAHILFIDIRETAGNAVTGGIDIGTAAAGQQIVAAVAVGASASVSVAPASILAQWFGPNTQQIFITAHSAWNSASVNITIGYCAREQFGTGN
jgi:hypothetical protein